MDVPGLCLTLKANADSECILKVLTQDRQLKRNKAAHKAALFFKQVVFAFRLFKRFQARFEQGYGVRWIVDAQAFVLKGDVNPVPCSLSLFCGEGPRIRMPFMY